MTSTTIVRPLDATLHSALRLALVFALFKLLLQFGLTLYTQHLGYGFFRDEFYYIACGRHLAWGYVDHGPIVALQARLGEIFFGDSLFAVRILSAIAGAITIFLGGLITWALGGRRPAQALAMLGLLCCLQYIGVDGFLSMNSWEPVFWMLCVLPLLLVLRGGSQRLWWPVLGVAAGVGILNKPSIAMFLVALLLGLLCTRERKLLFTPWAATGMGLLLVVPLPYVFWQVRNHWPMLEFLHNGAVHHKNTVLGPVAFFMAQFGIMQPVNALLWITGIVALLRGRSIAQGRWLGLAFVFFYLMAFVTHSKDYYLAPIYPAFFAAGAIAWEHRFLSSRLVRQGSVFAFPVFETLLVISSVLILPMASPVLKPVTWARYTQAMHLVSNHNESAESGILPQFFADRFGWGQEVGIVVNAFRSLSPQEQRTVCIYGDNYGDAGAIDFLGHKEEPRLPPAISRHNNYWIWGPHDCNAELVISVTGDTREELLQVYNDVTVLGAMNDPLAMPHEHKNVYLLRGRRPERPFIWWNEKMFI